ncbi:unnamed protein product, partial [Rotaria sp. Silwood1]
MVDSQFNGKNPANIMKQSNQNRQNHAESQIANKSRNRKQITASYLREAKDKDRALGLADIKMLADRKRRKITVYNSDTGEKEIINPSG